MFSLKIYSSFQFETLNINIKGYNKKSIKNLKTLKEKQQYRQNNSKYKIAKRNTKRYN